MIIRAAVTDKTMLKDVEEILEGRYKVHKKLGYGAFGEIWKGKVGGLMRRSGEEEDRRDASSQNSKRHSRVERVKEKANKY